MRAIMTNTGSSARCLARSAASAASSARGELAARPAAAAAAVAVAAGLAGAEAEPCAGRRGEAQEAATGIRRWRRTLPPPRSACRWWPSVASARLGDGVA